MQRPHRGQTFDGSLSCPHHELAKMLNCMAQYGHTTT